MLQPPPVPDRGGVSGSAVAGTLQLKSTGSSRKVDVIDALIRSITLPGAVRTAIEQKIAEEQAMLACDFTPRKEEKESQRKSIEADGIRTFNDKIMTPDSRVLQWKSIEANLKLAKSPSAKVIVVGGSGSVPVLVGVQNDAGLPSKAVI